MATKTSKTTAKKTTAQVGSAVSKTEVIYTKVTNTIMGALSQNVIPWRRSWKMNDVPRNFDSGREYQGINLFLLAIYALVGGYGSPFWMTFNQAKNLGGSVRKGQKGNTIVFWRISEQEVEAGKAYDFERSGTFYRRIFALREWTVFNLEQCDMPAEVVTKHTDEFLNPNAVERSDAEAVFANMPNPPKRTTGRPSYSPSMDTVRMPAITQFACEDDYYHTLAHEMIHSTGHKSRLNRREIMETKGRFGGDTASYGLEELVAEIGACNVSGRLGVNVEDLVLNGSADYIKGWMSAFTTDPSMIIKAAGRAHKATRYIFGEDVPEIAETETV